MKPHITEFHVCGRVAESPQHVAFRQQLPSHHWLEAEAPLAGGDESRLDADRPASTLSPRSRPARNRSSPTGTWALPRWCSTRRMTWRKRCGLQRDASPCNGMRRLFFLQQRTTRSPENSANPASDDSPCRHFAILNGALTKHCKDSATARPHNARRTRLDGNLRQQVRPPQSPFDTAFRHRDAQVCCIPSTKLYTPRTSSGGCTGTSITLGGSGDSSRTDCPPRRSGRPLIRMYP